MWLRLSCNWQTFRERMRHTRRIVVIDTETFKEYLSFELTGTKVVTVVGIGAMLLVALTTVIIAFTPLRNLIPGYVNPTMVEQTYHNARVIDSLESELEAQGVMIAKIQDIVDGKDMSALDLVVEDTVDEGDIVYSHSDADKELRRAMERNSRTR